MICPLSQLSAAPPSRVHWNVAAAPDWKEKVAVFEVTVSPSAGPEVIVTSDPPAATARHGSSNPARPAHAKAGTHLHRHRRAATAASSGESKSPVAAATESAESPG